MRKSAKIYLIVFVWAAALVQLFVNERIDEQSDEPDIMNEVFAESNYGAGVDDKGIEIKVWGDYGDSSYSRTVAENILYHTAQEIGISDQGEISCREDADKQIITYTNFGEDGRTCITFIVYEEADRSILCTDIFLYGNSQDNNGQEQPDYTHLLEQVEDFYDSIGVVYSEKIS